MDQNAELFLARTVQPPRWEDEEKATNDVEQLRAEFLRRLYAAGDSDTPAGETNGSAGRDAK
jgi:hypothetical protein